MPAMVSGAVTVSEAPVSGAKLASSVKVGGRLAVISGHGRGKAAAARLQKGRAEGQRLLRGAFRRAAGQKNRDQGQEQRKFFSQQNHPYGKSRGMRKSRSSGTMPYSPSSRAARSARRAMQPCRGGCRLQRHDMLAEQ